jgi:hypothetical protein
MVVMGLVPLDIDAVLVQMPVVIQIAEMLRSLISDVIKEQKEKKSEWQTKEKQAEARKEAKECSRYGRK